MFYIAKSIAEVNLTLIFDPNIAFALQRHKQLMIAFLFLVMPVCGIACFGLIRLALNEEKIV